MKHLLITGSSGFIGRYTIEPLRQAGFEVYALDSSIDLLQTEKIQEILYDFKPTHLLHLAWLTTPGVFFESPDNLKWVEATLALVRHFKEFGGQRFIGAGTCFETLLSDPSETFYGFCKNSTRLLLEKYCEKSGLEFAWGRIYFLYGPHERPERLVPSIVRGLLKGEEVACTQGKQIRDYMYVEDCAKCFVDLVSTQSTGVFDIASGQSIQLKELILAFAHALGRSDLIKFGARPERLGEPEVIVAKDIFSGSMKTSFQDSISKTINYWRQQIQ